MPVPVFTADIAEGFRLLRDLEAQRPSVKRRVSSPRIDPPRSTTAMEIIARERCLANDLKREELALRSRELERKGPVVKGKGSSASPRTRIASEAKEECFGAMRRRLKNNAIERRDDLRKAIADYFEDESKRPSRRTIQAWAKVLWDEYVESSSRRRG